MGDESIDFAALLKKAETSTESQIDWKGLLDKDSEKPKREKRTTSAKRLTDFTKMPRTIDQWMKLDHIVHPDFNCTVPSHDEQQAPRNKVVIKIDELYVCRYCFVNGRDIV